MIQYRGNTLNSKAGYNRSGISRLVLPEKEEDARESTGGMESSRRLDEVADPRGLNMLNQVPTGGKRKENQHRDNQPRTQKRKKMKYETLEEDWGNGAGDDLERIELEESARRSFLQDGQVDRKAGSNSRQTTIRIWKREELMCRKIVENLIEGTAKRSNFMYSWKKIYNTFSVTLVTIPKK